MKYSHPKRYANPDPYEHAKSIVESANRSFDKALELFATKGECERKNLVDAMERCNQVEHELELKRRSKREAEIKKEIVNDRMH